MDDDNYDDYFSDDGIDDLPAGALLELEQNAYEATQRQRSESINIPRPTVNAPPALQRNSTSADSRNAPPQPKPPVLQDPSLLLRPPLSFGQGYLKDLDAGVLDDGYEQAITVGEDEDVVYEQDDSRRALQPTRGVDAHRAIQNRSLRNVSTQEDSGTVDAEPSRARGSPIPREHSVSFRASQQTLAGYGGGEAMDTAATSQALAEIEEMRQQIEQLTRDRERVLQDLADAKSIAEAKAGEIAIIRANQIKMEKNYDRQMSALKDSMTDDARKHQAQVEAAIMESNRLATENAFLKQDAQEAQEEVNRANAIRKTLARTDDNNGGPITPRKSRILPLRDGFDDDEMMASPTKSAGRRSKRGTPSAAGKRKRKATEDSPVQARALDLSETFEISDDHGVLTTEPTDIEHVKASRPKREDRNVQMIRKILNHRTYPHKARDMEVFTTLSFPSEPGRLFSSFILEATTTRVLENYAVEYAKAVIALWARSMKESFYKPVELFMGIIKYILYLDTPRIAPQLIEDLLAVLQTSAYVNGVPRFLNSPVSHLNLGQLKQTPRNELHPEVNSSEILDILYLVAGGCQYDISSTREFWQNMSYDAILIMLNCSQPITDIIATFNLLSYSIIPDTFGPILRTPEEQAANENYIIDRVANLLSEHPRVDEGEQPYSPWQIATLRIEAMSLLSEIAFSFPDASPDGRSRAGRVVATHPSALARVFRAMHDELDALYSYPPERALHATLVNGLTRLAYGLVIRDFRHDVNMSAKLRIVRGATQKHLVVLTRLAFCDGPVLEAGIEDETVEMAHEMLEEAVNPQEAEALLEAFRSSKNEE
ncbi:hypothetical protein AJ80_05532 [Polytolypa hystricis UAMH7299]|uniref:DNA repair protein Rad26 n=1 Tax=Polytolypa hystricis (strain UAMH7299) TaxID=1447883 RepID=A0A2B7Y2U4_POLH7|nr:hypothetical protein AJ80_05532 [Polytolypa hystricis UAMH7299]